MRRSRDFFVTSHGRHYHRFGRHFYLGRVAVTKRDAEREGYLPCSHCFGIDPVPVVVGRDPTEPFLRLARKYR